MKLLIIKLTAEIIAWLLLKCENNFNNVYLARPNAAFLAYNGSKKN